MDPLASSDAYSPLIQCLVSWGKGNDVIRLISDWLEAAINQTDKDRESEEEEEESEDQVTMEIVHDALGAYINGQPVDTFHRDLSICYDVCRG